MAILGATQKARPEIFEHPPTNTGTFMWLKALVPLLATRKLKLGAVPVGLILMLSFGFLFLKKDLTALEVDQVLESRPPERSLVNVHSSIKKKDFKQVIADLSILQKEDPQDYYRNCYLGVSYLSQARGLLTFNQLRVNQGIEYLNKALELATKNNEHAKIATCNFFLGKAYLMKKDPVLAREHFQNVLAMNQEKMKIARLQKLAREILSKL